jgi:hypothetical protein
MKKELPETKSTVKEPTKKETRKNQNIEQGVIKLHLENEDIYKIKGETLLAIMNSLNVMQSLINIPCIQVDPVIGKIAQDINDNK